MKTEAGAKAQHLQREEGGLWAYPQSDAGRTAAGNGKCWLLALQGPESTKRGLITTNQSGFFMPDHSL